MNILGAIEETNPVRTLGIRALLVEPAFAKTKMNKNSSVSADPIGDYFAAREGVVAGILTTRSRRGIPPVLGVCPSTIWQMIRMSSRWPPRTPW